MVEFLQCTELLILIVLMKLEETFMGIAVVTQCSNCCLTEKKKHKQTSQKPVPSVILQSCSHTAFTRHIDEKLPGPLWKNHLKSFYLFIAHCSPFMLSP